MATTDTPEPQIDDSALKGLIRRANLRLRAQRFADVACSAALPALVLAAMSILLAKHGVVMPGELTGMLALLGVTVVGAGLVAALWRISPLDTLIRLDDGNAFSDRLSSAWAFLALPPSERTPEQQLHLERTMARLAEVEPARAHVFHRPPDAVPALLMAAVTVFTGLLAEPSPDPLPPIAAIEAPAPRFILDLAALRPEIRQVEELAELAEQSGDEELQAIADELQSIVERAERGVLDEETLLDELASIEERLAELEAEPPPDLAEDWEEVATRLREALDESEELDALREMLPDEVEEQVDGIIDAIAEGDEEAIADGLNVLEDLLDNQDLDLSEEELAALADALEQFADAFDPVDLGLQDELDALRDRFAELERESEGGRSSRAAQELDEAREQLADAEQALADATDGLDEGGESRRDVAEALRDAAESLREDPSAEPSDDEPGDDADPEAAEDAQASDDREQPEGEPGERDPDATAERDAEDGEEADEQREPTGNQGDDSEASGETDETAAGDSGEMADSSDSRQQPEGESSEQGEQGGEPREQGDPTDGEAGERADAESDDPSAGDAGDAGQEASSPREQAADQLDRAAEQLRDRERREAAAEGRDRAQEAAEGIRENLQRNSADPDQRERDEMAENTWDDFMDRAEGRESSEEQPEGEPQGESSRGGDPSEQEASTNSGQQPGSDGASGYGDEAGDDALGDESTGLDSERERVEAEVEVGEDGEPGPPTTSEVVESAAVEGFATRGYVEVYEEYADSVEQALREGRVPLGYARFVERYFSLIEPRIAQEDR